MQQNIPEEWKAEYLLTYSLEQSLLEKLTSFHLVKEFPALYGT
jgi:hypothetical protein